MLLSVVLLCTAYVVSIHCDCYLHQPRGSNNRLNGAGVNAGNQNRLFDSQNNAKGGYNVGVGNSENIDDTAGAMNYYPGSKLLIEWTNQHACGDFEKGGHNSESKSSKIRECEIILQYMCLEDNPRLRNGFSETRPPTDREDNTAGQHETRQYYNDCKDRQRNKGLFTADRNLRGNSAIYTRQNNNGNRHGYECAEERDYYPYWHPSPWRDIAIMTNNVKRCPYYQRESQNVKGKGYCTVPTANNRKDCEKVQSLTDNQRVLLDLRAKHTDALGWVMIMDMKAKLGLLKGRDDKAYEAAKTVALKEAQDPHQGLKAIDAELADWPIGIKGQWVKSEPHGIPAPECAENNWSRSNHLGNGFGAQPLTYEWTIPEHIVTNPKFTANYPTATENKCVFRIRYNMSSSDYDNWNTHSWGNYDYRVIKHRPEVIEPVDKLQLTINTNQVARTFQDRSHVFKVHKTVPTTFSYPGGDDVTANYDSSQNTIWNLNVRGKRGNIVQTYPAVEYDFNPGGNPLKIKSGDFVHFQWTGSNTNPRNYAGQGARGTDRSNVMQICGLEDNIPLPMDKTTMWGDPTSNPTSVRHRYMYMALLNQTNPLLNAAPAYVNYPPIQFNKPGVYHFTCSRNNNFSNRSQKGTIVVDDAGNATSKCDDEERSKIDPTVRDT